MSNREVILQALEGVRRRLRLRRSLHTAAVVLGMVAVGLLLWRVLHLSAGGAPIVAAAILAALLLWVAGLLLLMRSWSAPRCTLGEAAALADTRACLGDQLISAQWFLERSVSSPWIDAQVARAAQSARGLAPAALLPLRLGGREVTAAAVAGLLTLMAWLVPPLAPPSDAATSTQPQPQAQARQVQLIRDLIAQTQDGATAERVERALSTFERKTASAEQKRHALSEAEHAIEQQGLESAATRERLYRLAGTLRDNKPLEEVARALAAGDAQGAARFMQRMAVPYNPMGLEPQGPSLGQSNEEQELARLLAVTANNEDPPGRGQSVGVVAKEAADRLTRIAQRLTAQDHWNQAAQALQQLKEATDTGLSSPAGSRQQRMQDAAHVPDASGTGFAGADAHQGGVMAQANTPSEGKGGKSEGVAVDAQSEAVLGAKVAPLAVQLQREIIHHQSPEARDVAPNSWFYAETKEQKSAIAFDGGNARSEFALGQSAALDGVAFRHRHIVKEYFMSLRQGAQP